MTSPHERDGRFYGLNEDPATRNPYVDPRTGYPPTQNLPVQDPWDDRDRYQDVNPVPATPATALPRRNSNRAIGFYIGGLVATAACAMVGAYLLFVVGVSAVYRQFSEHGYWADHRIAAPSGPTADVVLGLTVLAVLAAGAVMWLMTLAVPQPRMFFTILGLIVTALVVVWLVQNDAAAVSAPLAVATAVVSLGIVLGVAMCGTTLAAGSEAK